MPSVAEKKTNSEKFRRHYLSSNQKLASTKTLSSAFLTEIEKLRTSYDPDMLIVFVSVIILCIVIM